MKKIKLRAYIWKCEEDAEYGILCIAKNLQDAKRMGYNWHGHEYGHDEDFIEQRCHWLKKGDVEGLSCGVYEDYADALKRNLFDWFQGECPICEDDDCMVSKNDAGLIGCDSCINKEVGE